MNAIENLSFHAHKALENAGMSLDESVRLALTQPVEQKGIDLEKMDSGVKDIAEIFLMYFFELVRSKKAFCDPGRIEEHFGRRLEENYGISGGLFIDFAKTYWTLKLLIDESNLLEVSEEDGGLRFSEDSETSGYNNVTSAAWCTVERMVGSLFFPMPGPLKQPRWLRKQAQKRFLKNAASDLNTKEFFRTNPFV